METIGQDTFLHLRMDPPWKRGGMFVIDRGELFISGSVLDAQTGQVIHNEERFGSIRPPTVAEKNNVSSCP